MHNKLRCHKAAGADEPVNDFMTFVETGKVEIVVPLSAENSERDTKGVRSARAMHLQGQSWAYAP